MMIVKLTSWGGVGEEVAIRARWIANPGYPFQLSLRTRNQF